MNLLTQITPDSFPGLKWHHPPSRWEVLPGNQLRVCAPGRVDYFQDPAGILFNDSAPFLYQEISGDFIARTRVEPSFDTTYDAGALMVRQDDKNWCKLCYESTDFGTKAVVSVVTRFSSDDANGPNLNAQSVFLQAFRLGNVFGFHYSLDGVLWNMVRLFRLELSPTVKVGIVTQSPIGQGTAVIFHTFEIENRSISNPRSGV